MSAEPVSSGPEIQQGRPHAVFWRRLGLVAGASAVLIGSLGGWRLLSELQRLRAQQASGEQAALQLKELQQRYEELSGTHLQLVADRDNLVTQTRRALEEKEQAQTERQVLEENFKRAETERLALVNRLKPLEAQVVELERNYERTFNEREQLEKQLTKAKGRSQEKALQAQLEEVRKKEQEMRRTLLASQRALRQMSRREQKASANLMRLGKRLETLQGEYGEEVSENAALRRKVERLPKDVTNMAREHERLLKDIADTHYNMGVMFTKKRDYVRASKEFQQVIELRPDDVDAHYNLGVIYAEHVPDRARAFRFFRKYLALNPTGRDVSRAKEYLATWNAWEGKERLE